MRTLLLGAKGQLGLELAKLLPHLQLGEIHTKSRAELDLLDLNALDECLQTLKPQIVINASAYTAVDQAQIHAHDAHMINHLVPERLALYAKTSQTVLVHYSTDFVFDGTKRSPYIETDKTHPLNVYGQTKCLGEQSIQSSRCKHLIFRTGWLMGAEGQNFLKTMLLLASEKRQLKVVYDQIGAPTSAKWLADISTMALKSCLMKTENHAPPPWGLYHASSKGMTSWHAYAQEVISYAATLGAKFNLNPEDVLPIPSVDYPLPATRPVYSVLDHKKLKATFGVEPPHWIDAVHKVLVEMAASGHWRTSGN